MTLRIFPSPPPLTVLMTYNLEYKFSKIRFLCLFTQLFYEDYTSHVREQCRFQLTWEVSLYSLEWGNWMWKLFDKHHLQLVSYFTFWMIPQHMAFHLDCFTNKSLVLQPTQTLRKIRVVTRLTIHFNCGLTTTGLMNCKRHKVYLVLWSYMTLNVLTETDVIKQHYNFIDKINSVGRSGPWTAYLINVP